MNTKLTIILLALLGCAFYLNAQVTVGSNNEPEDFSILQVESQKKGVRLPQSTSADKTAINMEGKTAPEQSIAGGLLIYNKTDDAAEYWDGTQWISLKKQLPVGLSASNGLSLVDENKIELGGTLTANTTISIGANELSFPDTGTNGTGELNIQTNALVAKGGNVGIRNADPATKLHINSSITGKGLRIQDGSENNDYVLVSDAGGNASWAPLKPFQSVALGSVMTEGSYINGNSQYFPSNGNRVKVSRNDITLYPGKWLVMAKLAVRTVGSSGTNTQYTHSLYLRNETSNTDESTVSMFPERSGWKVSVPQMVQYVEINTTSTFSLYSSRAWSGTNENVYIFNTFGGEGFFFAIRIDAL